MTFELESLLHGVPRDYVAARLGKAAGKELDSGKFFSPQSSSALAVNAFAWFHPKPELLPPLPGLHDIGPAKAVDVEFEARFPWAGGRHPWLDAVVLTAESLIGIESKRFEPFRDQKVASFSPTYRERAALWPEAMAPWFAALGMLSAKPRHFRFLDAAQLIKHALGIERTAARQSLRPALAYVYAEPPELQGRSIAPADIAGHRAEIDEFAAMVAGGSVRFVAFSYRDWLASWPHTPALLAHRDALLVAFNP